MFGSHLSIAGGMDRALREAESLGMDTVQVFTKNQQQWKVRPLDPAAIADWTGELDRLGWRGRTVAHASYLINLASPDDELWHRSIDLMRIEIERCEALAIPYLVHHPGAYTTSTAGQGIRRIARAYKNLLGHTRGYATICCLKNTVGSGSNLGRTFEELALLRDAICDATGAPDRVGYCFDTCHAHAGGYDLSTRAGAEEVLKQWDATCGMRHLKVVHINDSKAPAGSRRDRHAHIGQGTIGGPSKRPTAARLARSGFAAVVNRPELAPIPKILETPKETTPTGTPMDRLNLARLRKLVETADKPPTRSA
ncbi:MAG: deoxyribonuclease IV [Phycisphaerales bacterium JB039]